MVGDQQSLAILGDRRGNRFALNGDPGDFFVCGKINEADVISLASTHKTTRASAQATNRILPSGVATIAAGDKYAGAGGAGNAASQQAANISRETHFEVDASVPRQFAWVPDGGKFTPSTTGRSRKISESCSCDLIF